MKENLSLDWKNHEIKKYSYLLEFIIKNLINYIITIYLLYNGPMSLIKKQALLRDNSFFKKKISFFIKIRS